MRTWNEWSSNQRTSQHSRHERTEHEEEHAEEEAASIIVCLARLVANAQVEQTNEESDTQV